MCRPCKPSWAPAEIFAGGQAQKVQKRLPIMRKGSKRARTGPTLDEKGPLLGEQSIGKDEGEMMKFLLIISGGGGGGRGASFYSNPSAGANVPCKTQVM